MTTGKEILRDSILEAECTMSNNNISATLQIKIAVHIFDNDENGKDSVFGFGNFKKAELDAQVEFAVTETIRKQIFNEKNDMILFDDIIDDILYDSDSNSYAYIFKEKIVYFRLSTRIIIDCDRYDDVVKILK
jgi:hypothetical protein